MMLEDDDHSGHTLPQFRSFVAKVLYKRDTLIARGYGLEILKLKVSSLDANKNLRSFVLIGSVVAIESAPLYCVFLGHRI